MRNINNYVQDKVLGFGAYASVKLAKLKSDNSENPVQYAIKTYEKYKLIEPSKMKNVQRVQILNKLNHPNIIRLFAAIDTPKQIYLVMEYIGANSLITFLRTRPGRHLDEKEAKSVFKQLVTAIDHCHSLNIVHRDIKLENIMVDATAAVVKVIDFGFAVNVADDKKLNIYCGTPSYMAPEILGKMSYRPKPTDIWALGVVLFYLLNGTFPYKGNDDKDIFKQITKGKLEFNVPNLSSEAVNLISRVLTVNPDDRITASEILNHPWFLEYYDIDS